MEQGLWNDSLYFPSVVSEASLGKSIHQFISSSPLRMINSLELHLSSSESAFQPRRMEVNSGKSIHHSLSGRFTLKHNAMTVIKCTITKQKRFQTGHVYSSFSCHSIHPSIPTKRTRNCCSLHSILPFQSLPRKAHSQFHTHNNP